jgi:hypothetical protein
MHSVWLKSRSRIWPHLAMVDAIAVPITGGCVINDHVEHTFGITWHLMNARSATVVKDQLHVCCGRSPQAEPDAISHRQCTEFVAEH